MSKIILFYHPGAEARPNQIDPSGREFFKEWNYLTENQEGKLCGDHCRNFIKSRGEYVDSSGQKHSGDLAFWGEWEPEARVVEKYGEYDCPTRLVEPIACNPTNCRPQNTDPFVFGEYFRYSNCKQNSQMCGNLKRLQKGDMILFGSGSHTTRIFSLDTVFVVDEGKIPFTRASDLSKIPDFDVYNHYVLKWTGLPNRAGLVYYPGKTFDPANPDEPFSFSPAKLYGANCAFGKISFLLDGQTQGIKTIEGADVRIFGEFIRKYGEQNVWKEIPNKKRETLWKDFLKARRIQIPSSSPCDVQNVWKEIRNKVLGQGCVLGVHFDLPPLPSTSSSVSGNSNYNKQGVRD